MSGTAAAPIDVERPQSLLAAAVPEDLSTVRVEAVDDGGHAPPAPRDRCQLASPCTVSGASLVALVASGARPGRRPAVTDLGTRSSTTASDEPVAKAVLTSSIPGGADG